MPPFAQSVNEDASKMIMSGSRSPLKFFLLVFALSLPFWIAGSLTRLRLLPGLPVSSLMCFCPATAALILAYREDKTSGVAELLNRSFDGKRIVSKIWYAPIILLKPAIMVLSYGLMAGWEFASSPAVHGPGGAGHVARILRRRLG